MPKQKGKATKITIGGNVIVEAAYRLLMDGKITEEEYEKMEERLRNMSEKERQTTYNCENCEASVPLEKLLRVRGRSDILIDICRKCYQEYRNLGK